VIQENDLVGAEATQMPAKSTIKILPTPFADVELLLKSDALRAVEEPIAAGVDMKVVYDYTSASVSIAQAWISVGGMTCQELEQFVAEHRDALIRFGIRFQTEQRNAESRQEYPEGEEPGPGDEDEIVEVHGLANGFGATLAAQFNFLANRTPQEHRDYLNNRGIRPAAKFAKDLRRIFDESQQP
jgi:hypothetical protein